MASSADQKRLSHNSRHKSEIRSVDQPTGLQAVLDFDRQHPEFEFFRKWGLNWLSLCEDPWASEVLSRMAKAWFRVHPWRLYVLVDYLGLPVTQAQRAAQQT